MLIPSSLITFSGGMKTAAFLGKENEIGTRTTAAAILLQHF